MAGVWLVRSGLVGAFEYPGDRPVYQRFYRGGEFVSDVASLRGGAPSLLTFVALEETEADYIRKADLLALYGEDAAFLLSSGAPAPLLRSGARSSPNSSSTAPHRCGASCS